MNPMYLVAAAAFAVQLVLCFLVRRRLFAQIPTMAAASVLLYGIASFSGYLGFGASPEGAVVSIMAIMTGIMLFVGIILAWILYFGFKMIKKMGEKKI